MNLLPPSRCPGDSRGPVPALLPAPACPAGRAKLPLGGANVGHAAPRGEHLRGPRPAVAQLPQGKRRGGPTPRSRFAPPAFGVQREPGRAAQPTGRAAKRQRVLGATARRSVTR